MIHLRRRPSVGAVRGTSLLVLLALGLAFTVGTGARAAQAASGRVHLPAALNGPISGSTGPLPTPDPAHHSRVMDGVPAYPGSQLAFFEAQPGPASDPSHAGQAVAWYLAETSPGAVGAWYSDQLPRYGWTRLRTVDTPGDVQTWARARGHLTVTLEAQSPEPGTRIVLTALRDAVRTVSAGVVSNLPVPPGANLLRADPKDLLADEVTVAGDLDATIAETAARFVAEDWDPDAQWRLDDIELRSFTKAADRAVVAGWQVPGWTVLSLGYAPCSLPQEATMTDSVYLAEQRRPSFFGLESFDFDTATRVATERHATSCMDIDIGRTLAFSGAVSDTWAVVEPSERWPGGYRRVTQRATVTATHTLSVTSSGLRLEIATVPDGRRDPAGRSLLQEDVVLPPNAAPLSMRTDVDGWRWLERYRTALPDTDSAAAWFEAALPAADWEYERREPSGSGDALIFHRGGEELLVDVSRPESVALQRHRVCPGGDPLPPDGEPADARWLKELVVYPGAFYLGFEDQIERYAVDCANLDLLESWYRTNLQDRWALVAAESPNRFRRQLLFVRPDEIGLPSEEWTAWARVAIERVWPYRYRLELQRDPDGIRPAP